MGVRLFLAGKAAENCAIYQERAGNEKKAVEFYQIAADYYTAQGSAELAAKFQEKAAKLMEPINFEQAVQLYVIACNTILEHNQGKKRQSIEISKRILNTLLKLNRYSLSTPP